MTIDKLVKIVISWQQRKVIGRTFQEANLPLKDGYTLCLFFLCLFPKFFELCKVSSHCGIDRVGVRGQARRSTLRPANRIFKVQTKGNLNFVLL